MAAKEKAIPLPIFKDKTVLDVGCDHGHWSTLASARGASSVLGLDRGREIDGQYVDLVAANRLKHFPNCSFEKINIGKQWREFGKFDVVMCFSLYHHLFENCNDHDSVWYWLWKHTGEVLLWENPVNDKDPVVRLNVGKDKIAKYTAPEILFAAEKYFEIEYVGPALHVPTRYVWRCIPRKPSSLIWIGKIEPGQGGAKKAFEYAEDRRIKEIEQVLGIRVLPGSLNARLDRDFDWDRSYYRAEILDLVDRKGNLDGEWKQRWARFYPVKICGVDAHVFSFEDEKYNANFIELIAPVMLRKLVNEKIDVRSC